MKQGMGMPAWTPVLTVRRHESCTPRQSPVNGALSRTREAGAGEQTCLPPAAALRTWQPSTAALKKSSSSRFCSCGLRSKASFIFPRNTLEWGGKEQGSLRQPQRLAESRRGGEARPREAKDAARLGARAPAGSSATVQSAQARETGPRGTTVLTEPL